VNGKNAAPIYKFLKSQKGGIFGDGIKWNFTKFLVNKEGKVVERYAPTTSPLKIEVRTTSSLLFSFFFSFSFPFIYLFIFYV
jgi:glutathione peroxidase-family protein